MVETLLPEPRSPASVITSAVVPAIRCGMILRHPYTRRCWAIRKNIVNRFSTRLILTLSVLTFLSFGDVIQAGSLGAFLRAFAHSHRHHRSHSSNRERPELNSQPEMNNGQSHNVNAAVTPPVAPSVAPTRAPVESGTHIPPVTQDVNRNLPFGIPVPNKEGIVKSPYAPNRGFVDVRGFPGGTEVKDPYTGKVFLTPRKE